MKDIRGVRNDSLFPKTRVRCLGPNPKEHYFASANPRGERVCAKCREKQRNMNLSRLSQETPTPTESDS